MVVWVDDCVIADNDPSLRAEFVQWLETKFPVDDKGELHWVLHVKVDRDRPGRTISLSQELYVQDLLDRYSYLLDGLTRRFDSPHDASVTLTAEQCPSPESPEQMNMQRHQNDYMSLVGAFLWLSNVSRPELAYISGQLARFVSNPGMAHYRAALRVLVYLRGTLAQSASHCCTNPLLSLACVLSSTRIGQPASQSQVGLWSSSGVHGLCSLLAISYSEVGVHVFNRGRVFRRLSSRS